MFRTLRRLTVAWLRAAENVALFVGRRPWKIDKVSRLIQPDIQAAARAIGSARVVVGIPFHKEAGNIGRLVATTQRDLEARLQDAAVVIVGERRTRPILIDAHLPPSTARVKAERAPSSSTRTFRHPAPVSKS